MKPELKQHLSIAKAISTLLHPFAEVVLHDIKKDAIEAIFNPISKREVGDKSYLQDLNFDAKSATIIGPYKKKNYDGRQLKSISTAIYNSKKVAVGFLCINLDISLFDKYKDLLQSFLSTNEDEKETTKNLFKNDLHERINSFINDYCITNHLHLESLNRNEKKAIVLKLKANGALDEINGPQYAARTLNVTRATVYNYLKES